MAVTGSYVTPSSHYNLCRKTVAMPPACLLIYRQIGPTRHRYELLWCGWLGGTHRMYQLCARPALLRVDEDEEGEDDDDVGDVAVEEDLEEDLLQWRRVTITDGG